MANFHIGAPLVGCTFGQAVVAGSGSPLRTDQFGGPAVFRGILVTGAGSLTITLADSGESVTLIDLAPGILHGGWIFTHVTGLTGYDSVKVFG